MTVKKEVEAYDVLLVKVAWSRKQHRSSECKLERQTKIVIC